MVRDLRDRSVRRFSRRSFRLLACASPDRAEVAVQLRCDLFPERKHCLHKPIVVRLRDVDVLAGQRGLDRTFGGRDVWTQQSASSVATWATPRPC
jgi:hypothetical protein